MPENDEKRGGMTIAELRAELDKCEPDARIFCELCGEPSWKAAFCRLDEDGDLLILSEQD